MSKPAIVTVDDDPMVSAAITRDLRSRYGTDYRVVRATSGAEALTVLTKLALRNQPVALIASDQRMPEMTGIEIAGTGAHPGTGREVPAAHGVRRHRRRHQGDQRDRPRLLPAQAVGSSRGAALPRHRRLARRLAPCQPGPHVGPACRGAPVVRPQSRDQDLPGPEPRALPLVRRRARRRGAAVERPRSGDRGRAPAGSRPRRRNPSARRRRSVLRTRSACARGPNSRCTTCASWAAARRAWPPRCTRRRRG